MNMEENGYLPIDRIIVREFKDGKYVVLEGNRRICAAKQIGKYNSEGSFIDPDILETFDEIPCLLYVGEDQDAAWIFQGLRHITGISDWSSFNKAKLLVEQMEREQLNLTNAGKKFGLTGHGAGQWVRGYYAFKQACEQSDFSEEVDERVYPYFQELFSRSSAPVREWLEWSDKEYSFKNGLNFNEFLGWFYPRPIDEDDSDRPSDVRGDFEKRVLKRQDDIRQLAHLIREDWDEFENFRNHLSLEKAYSAYLQKRHAEHDKSDPVDDVFDVLEKCTKAVQDVPLRAIKTPENNSKFFAKIEELEKAINEIRDFSKNDR